MVDVGCPPMLVQSPVLAPRVHHGEAEDMSLFQLRVR
jgi:hypothetical protein